MPPYYNGYHRLNYDAVNQAVIAFINGDMSGGSYAIYSDSLWTYETSTQTLTEITSNHQPANGVRDASGTLLGNGCVQSTSTWPGTRHPVGQVWQDNIRHRLLVVDGVCGARPTSDMFYFQEQSPLSNTVWTQLHPAHLPNPVPMYGRNSSAVVHDTDDDVYVMWGYDMGANTKDTWVYCPTDLNPTPGALTARQIAAGCLVDDWALVQTTGGTPPGANVPGLVYDSVNKKVIQFGGSNTTGTISQNQTWAYDVPTKTWRNMNPSNPPTPPSNNISQSMTAMDFDPQNGLVYYHYASGAYGSSGVAADFTYNYATNTWTSLGNSSGPTFTQSIAYDASQNALIAWNYAGNGLLEIWTAQLGTSSNSGRGTAPVISTPSSLPSATQGQSYSTSFSAAGTSPISWLLPSGQLPAGLTLSNGGTLSGTPTAPEAYQFFVSSSKSIGTSPSVDFALTPSGSTPVITTSSPLISGTHGQPYSQSFAASGTGRISCSLSSRKVPAGINLNSSTGALSGTAAKVGAFSSAAPATYRFRTSSPVSFSIPRLAAPGLGHSTYNCVDVDGDGYGVGPGCTGPDADDTDPTVATYSDVIAKYGSLSFFWAHMGWSPTAVYYVDGGTGSCTAVSSPFAYAAPTACGTVDAAIAAMSAGQAVVLRASASSTRRATITVKPGTLNGSTCTKYSYYLTYPGEQALFTFSGQTGMSESGTQSCIVVDGWALTQGSGEIGMGSGISNSHTVYGYTLAHLDVSGFTWNIFPQYNQFGTLITHNYIHNAYEGGDLGHDIYLGSNVASSSGTMIIGNVINDAVDTCIHLNGPMTNITVDSNLIYGCSKAINVQSGISHSRFQNNIVHTNARYLFQIGTYANQYSTHTWQCHDENYNVIRNNTFWEDGQSWNPTGAPGGTQPVTADGGSSAIYIVDDGTCQVQASHTPDLGHNLYDNNIIVHSCATACSDYNGPLVRYTGTDAGIYLAADQWHNNILYNADDATRIIDSGPTANVAYGNCTWFAANVSGGGNLCSSDPQMAAANGTWATDPQNWNLTPLAGSPAVNAALASDSPAYDAAGVVRSLTTPTIGAYEK